MRADGRASWLMAWKSLGTLAGGVLAGGVGKAQTGEELGMLQGKVESRQG